MYDIIDITPTILSKKNSRAQLWRGVASSDSGISKQNYALLQYQLSYRKARKGAKLEKHV